MKVLRLYPFIPPCRGGIELHARNLSLQQRAMGHDVTVLFNQGIAEHPQDIRIARHFNLRKVRSQFGKDLLFYFSAIAHCLKVRARHDAMHIHGDWSAFWFGALLARIVRPHTRVASIHGELRSGLRSRIYRHVLAGYDVVYCTGFREANQLRALGISQARWQPSGVSDEFVRVSSASRAPKSVDVICVANLVPVKNIELLIRVAQQMPHVSFEVVGDGPLNDHLRITCTSLEVENVHFTGCMDRAGLAARLESARVFYLPSLTEGTPTSMMEAMTLGLPVVVTPSNDYRDIIRQGVNGLVTEDFSIENNTSAIKHLLSCPDLLAAIEASNLRDAKRFAWPEVARQITEWMQLNEGHERPSRF